MDFSDSWSDDGSYFDLDFSVPLSGRESVEKDDEFEFDFSVVNAAATDENPQIEECCNTLSEAAEESIFFDGQLVPGSGEMGWIPQDSCASQNCSGILPLELEGPATGLKTQFPALLRTATKLKISLLRLRKAAKNGADLESPLHKQNRFFTVKFRVIDVPLMSFFSKDASSRSSSSNSKRSEDMSDGDAESKISDKDRKRAKEIVQKYVRMIKPLYVKISQRQTEKSQAKNGKGAEPKTQNQNQSHLSFSLSGNLKTACKSLGKPKNQRCALEQKVVNGCRNESTLMELQNAIQGAIAHCKQSIGMDHGNAQSNRKQADEQR